MKSEKIKILLMILFILLGITMAYAQQKVKTFDLGKSGKIEVNLDYGDIKIETWGKDQVTVKYEEDEGYSSFKMVRNGNILTISSGDYSSEDLVISTPSSVNLDLNTDGGDILIEGNITGKVECSTAGGDIGTRDIRGNADLNTAGGEITAGEINGDVVINSGGGDMKVGTITGEARLSTGGGNIQIYNVGKQLKVTTGGGNVDAGNVGGVFAVNTGGGNVNVKKVSGEVKVTTGGGNVSVDGAERKANATTGGGNLSLRAISGSVDCYTGSGDVYIELNPDPQVNSEIKSGSGSVTLYLPGSAKATVVAKVRGWDSWGEDNSNPITSDFKITTEDKSSHSFKSTYVINGGGSTIKVETTSGEIHIKKQK